LTARSGWARPTGFWRMVLRGAAPLTRASPCLLTHARGPAANAPQALMAIDGAAVDIAEAALLERVWVIFDGALPEALERARAQWRELAAAVPAQYWAEDGGRWVKKAEHRPD